jgi:hypothetical protein
MSGAEKAPASQSDDAECGTAAQALRQAIETMQRLYESPSLASACALPLIDEMLPALRAGLDDASDMESGIQQWRTAAQANARHAEAARATARVAIEHLQAVLNNARTHYDQQRADTAARDWLISVGSDPA